MSINLFVYGTLKQGFYNHNVIEQSNGKFIGKGVTEPSFTMFSLGAYPGVYLGGTMSLKGEVYQVDSLDRTDWLEGYPEFYNRIVIPVTVGEKEILATIYYIKGEINHRGIIEDGEWCGT